MALNPIQSVYKVEANGLHVLPPEEVCFGSVGEKAFGLSCLPQLWTLPYLVVSCDLVSKYRQAANDATRNELVIKWGQQIRSVASVAIPCEGPILVRSSAISEPLEDRGRYHSIFGTFENLEQALSKCLSELTLDPDLVSEQVHLILQPAVTPVSRKGHLSNERRCYKEARDWLGEFEIQSGKSTRTFSVNLRGWRTKVNVSSELQQLSCNLEPLVSKILSIPAWWAHRHGVRLHFEWVWDGKRIYIVQADEPKNQGGVNPTKISRKGNIKAVNFTPQCLVPINEDLAKRYNKIRNVYTYLKLQLPIANLYVLEDTAVLDEIKNGTPPATLIADLEALVPASLVIRTDLATEDQKLRQLLPRTDGVRNVTDAMSFLKNTILNLSSQNVTDRAAFIFHNFIPATSSAFAYAAPGQRKVLIETLWGLPEGLYYNAHDKIEVDTGFAQIGQAPSNVMENFKVSVKPRFKRNFVAPDEYDNWITQTVAEPWDWLLSIPNEDWIRQIAFDTKRIAEQEEKSVSVMWFVGVKGAQAPLFAWYHEPFDFALVNKSARSRGKTPFDRSLVIRTKTDIVALEEETRSGSSTVREVKIQPQENDLLRNKELLKNIGELTKKIGAVILLEGGTLSHAYYQLMQTEAIVEVVYPFDASEEKREFNKLVRDKIPEKIQQGGESVRVTQLFGDQLLRVLREKLVEEAYESLAASNHNEIVDELADVEEVIEGILKQLKVTRKELSERQKTKNNKAGGFDEGYVLLDTNNPSPTRRTVPNDLLPFQAESLPSSGAPTIEHVSQSAPVSVLAKWSDRREHGSTNEQLLNLVVSLVSDNWTADSPDLILGEKGSGTIHARVQGKREGANLHLDISVFSSGQLRLPLD